MAPSATNMIETKRFKRRSHTKEELEWWIDSYCKGNIPEYQVAAWLMAVCWRGMSQFETSTLTRCMVQSGEKVDWGPSISSTSRVDKHSSGGVGDKVSLILAPLAAVCGLQVPMMAGRGLAHTGGTLDKLESIPGFTVQQSIPDFRRIVETVGCAIVSTTPEMVLADKKLYALRDVTGTVSSIPLQAASIVSKKIAEQPDSLVLDVKYGLAAFQSNLEDAIELAQCMIATAEANGVKPTSALLTRMDHPIGYAIGNWLEVKECIEILKTGEGAPDLVQLAVAETAQMLFQSKNNINQQMTFEQCIDEAHDALLSGKALDKFREMVVAQGGDVSVVDDVDSYPLTAQYSTTIHAKQNAYVANMNALIFGQSSVQLGAGRQVVNSPVDAVAGIWCHVKVGDKVVPGDPVATLFTNLSTEALDLASEQVQGAIEYSSLEQASRPQIISHRVSSSVGIEDFVMPDRLKGN